MTARLLVFLQIHSAIPSTHWIMTETGKIEAQPDSIYFMRQPHDFVAFIHQEQRLTDANDLHEKLSSLRTQLDESHSADVPDVETQVLNEDPNCILAGRPLTQYDLHVSTLVPVLSSVLENFHNIDVDPSFKLKEPWCSTKEIMKFNIPDIDSIKSVMDRKNLIMQGEIGLVALVLDDGKIQLAHFGHIVAQTLQKEKSSWVSYNLAALYWRMKGSAYESIECLRRALHFGTVAEAKPIALVSLGNILHHSQRSEDAAIVLEMAVDFDPTESVSHYTLGNVYAVLMQFNKSIECFDSALYLAPDVLWVKKRRAAVMCHQILERTLENQHTKLQKTLDELRSYQIEHDKWSSLNNKLHTVQAALETRVASRSSYEKFKLLTEGKNIRPQGCYETIENGKKFVECVVNSIDIVDKLTKQTVYRRNAPPSSEHDEPSDQMLNIFNKVEVSKENNEEEKVFGPQNKPKDYIENDKNKPSLKKKYPKDLEKAKKIKAKYLDTSWPGKEECKTHVSRFPDWAQLPTVYLPSENKGLNVKQMINEDIQLDPSTQHSLPWFPPVCDPSQLMALKLPIKYSILQGIKQTGTKEKYPDGSIKSKFLESFGQKKENENIAEVGARIKSAMEAQIQPNWLLNLLAANYWRIIGNSGSSSDCYSLALSEVPMSYKDLVLTNLGALLYRLGHIDSALRLLQEAVAVCDSEPETHFFLANLYAAKGNMTGAIVHYQAALHLEPDYPGGVEQLRIPSCYIKFHHTGYQAQHSDTDISCTATGEKREDAKCELIQREQQRRSCNGGDDNGGQPGQSDESSLTSIQGSSDYILCRNGHCQFVTQKEVDKIDVKSSRKEPISELVSKEDYALKRNCLKQEEERNVKEDEDKFTDTVNQEQMRKLPTGTVEIATIALTDDDIESEPTSKKRKVLDDDLPEILVRVSPPKDVLIPVITAEMCEGEDTIRKTFTSTWLSASAKDIYFSKVLPKNTRWDEMDLVEPKCQETPTSVRSMDHLNGVKRRHELQYKAEHGLHEAFQSLAGKFDRRDKEGVKKMANRLSLAFLKEPNSWILSTAATLYWRVQGNVVEAINCVRHSLYHCPDNMRDVPLISLANIMHRAGMFNDAVIATNMALEISPTFVVSHFTMANIYTSMKDMEKAKLFYTSTLTLQSTFAPAKERLQAILCGK